MHNSKPNNSKYNSGNYIPVNKDKVIRFNKDGGVYYRSGWERIIMKYLDAKPEIIKWGAECISIPYQMQHFENGMSVIKNHTYYSDFYYEIKSGDNIDCVVVEVKPKKEYNMAIALKEGKLSVPDAGGVKKLKNFEYDVKMAYKNLNKWETIIKFCNKKGYKFIIITEDHLKKFNV